MDDSTASAKTGLWGGLVAARQDSPRCTRYLPDPSRNKAGNMIQPAADALWRTLAANARPSLTI